MSPPPTVATRAIALLPGALVVYLGFNAGGFFPEATAVAVVVVAMVLLLRTALAADPFAGFGPLLGAAAGALALYTGWTLLSSTWSDAPARALTEFNRSLLYLLVLVLFGSLAWTRRSGSWLVRGLAVGIGVVSIAGLVIHLLPDVWQVPRDFEARRLGPPITYWNAMGLLSAFGVLLCLHLTGSAKEPPAARVLGAAAVPVLATTVFFTFSRGAIAAGVIGVLVYMVAARPRALVSGVLATVPATAVALSAAYGADRLAGANPTSAGAVAQGHDVALVVAMCAAAAAVSRLLLLLALDARLVRATIPQPPRRVVVGVGAAVLTAAVAAALALNLPGALADQYRLLVTTDPTGGDLRSRFTVASSKGRVDGWKVALQEFEGAEFKGRGAGTYQLAWEKRRPFAGQVRDAHSVYIEVLDELGLVGLMFLAGVVVMPLAAAARRLRGENRALYGALFAVGVTWALRAGIDWDWEMPVVTTCFFAVGGVALARSERAGPGRSFSRSARVAIAAGWLVLALTPVLIGLSQARLDKAERAYQDGNCKQAEESALASISVLAVRPEPYDILGYCTLRRGFDQQAVEAMERAVELDPENSTFHYDLAVARGAAGLDPRPEAAIALRLNPLDAAAQELVEDFRTEDPARWRRAAKRAASDLAPL